MFIQPNKTKAKLKAGQPAFGVISTTDAQPVLTDREFGAKLERFRASLEPATVM